MRRSSLIEFLIRIAAQLYNNQYKEFDHPQACRRLMSKILKSQNYKIEPWQSFRSRFIWTLPVDEFLRSNQAKFDAIFQIRAERGKITYLNATNLFVNDTDVKITYEQARFCYAYSKMTVALDSYTSAYTSIVFVEFLEMVCRVADIKYRETAHVGKPLADKASYILSDLLWSLLGPDYKFKEVVNTE